MIRAWRAWLTRRRDNADARVWDILAGCPSPSGYGFMQICHQTTMTPTRVDGALRRLLKNGTAERVVEPFGERQVTSYRALHS